MKRENILRYLKIHGDPDPLTDSLIASCMKAAEENAVPKRICRFFNLRFAQNGVYLDSVFFEGEKIKQWLSGCDCCAVFAATLGVQADVLLKKYSVSDPAAAAVLQAVLADYTEDICDMAENDIKQTMPPGYTMTKRFSPGYPGLPLSYQKNIFLMLEITKRIGITLTDSYLMIPTKSVTAFVGLKKDG